MKCSQFRLLRTGGALLALSGGMLALCAFFLLPYYSLEIWVIPSPASTIISVHDVSVTGGQLAKGDFPSPTALRLSPGEEIVDSFHLEKPYGDVKGFPLLWLEPLVAVIIIILAAVLLPFRRTPVMTNGPWLCIWLLIGVALLTLLILLALYHSDLSSPWRLISYSWGFWTILLGMFVVIVGASAVRLSWAGKPLTDRENGRVPRSVSHKQGGSTS